MRNEVVVLGNCLLTMEPDSSRQWCGVYLKGDRIVRPVSRHEVNTSLKDVPRIDWGNRPIMPGFIDVHAHSEVVCRTAYRTVDCRAPECSSVADVSEVLLGACADTPAGEWVVGQANLFFDRKIREGRLPTRAELDAVSKDHPIALRAGGHITVLNTRALEVAGIDRNYTPPTHSVTGPAAVERDLDGNPTGVVKEMDSLLPLPSPNLDELRTAIRDGLNRYFTANGVTTIGEISETVDGLECMNDLAGSDELPASMRVYLWSPGTLALDKVRRWQEHLRITEHGAIRIKGLKLFADGGFSAKSAAVNCCYSGHNDFRGQLAMDDHFFARAYDIAQDRGLQLAVHANGDRAQEWLCGTLIKLGGAGEGATRARIEHAGNLLPLQRTSDLWAKAGIIPVPQPVFLYTFGEYFPDYLGEYGKRGRFPFKSLIERGWHISGSSDVWIGSERDATNPFFSIWCCLKRQTYSGGFIDADEAVTIDQALRMHTIDAAATLGEADERGSIAPGKVADLIALDRDPRETSIDELRNIKVDHVMSRGRVVHSRPTSTTPNKTN